MSSIFIRLSLDPVFLFMSALACNKHLPALDQGSGDDMSLANSHSDANMYTNIDIPKCDIQRLTYVIEVLVSTGCDLGVDIIVLRDA